ncbi:DUF7533 family protein [Halocatena halophila]|uniref:DUF7533 family protein n=1 Tax=Halocatena halophila TaxID=2814576 RepID=UPI002ED070AB
MPEGIIDTITLAVTVAFAIPVAMLGMQFLQDGNHLLGGVFVGLAIAMVVVEETITSPTDLPAMALQRVTDRIAKPSDDEDD